jgi:hypothetical protein
MAIWGKNMKDVTAWRNVAPSANRLISRTHKSVEWQFGGKAWKRWRTRYVVLRSVIALSVWPCHNIQNHLNSENLGFSQIFTWVTMMGDDQNRGEREKRNILFSDSWIVSRATTRSQLRGHSDVFRWLGDGFLARNLIKKPSPKRS